MGFFFRMSINSDTDVKMFPYGTFIVLSLFCSLTTQHFVLDKPDHVEIEVTYSDHREGVVVAEKMDEIMLAKMWGQECTLDVQCSSIAVCYFRKGSQGMCTPNSMARIILGGMISLIFLMFLLVLTFCCSYSNFVYCPCFSYLCFVIEMAVS